MKVIMNLNTHLIDHRDALRVKPKPKFNTSRKLALIIMELFF